MATCDYVESFPDENTGKHITLECKNDAYKSKKCKFHLKRYLKKETRDEIIQSFLKELRDSKKSGKALNCTGYILPSISLIENSENKLNFPVYFAHAKFKENVDFSSVIFKKNVSFHKTIFYKSTKVRGSVFETFADFSFSVFRKAENSFRYTKFQAYSDFKNSTLRNTDFEWVNFAKTQFIDCTFSEETTFSNAVFRDNIDFTKAKFLGNATFFKSVFESVTNFDDVEFPNYTNFSKVIFPKEEDVIFNSNISNVSFLDTDIKKIKFGNKISWRPFQHSDEKKKKPNYVKKRKNSDFKIYEERLIEKRIDTEINLESVKNIYRDLRENFDMNLQYDTAGEFFIREMELQRKYEDIHKDKKLITTTKLWFWRGFSLYSLYNMVAQYGQSVRRPIYFAIPLIILGTFIFWDECITQVAMNLEDPCDASFWSAFVRSLSAFIPFFTFSEHPTIMDYALRLTLLPISGTFFISLKRKFERKLRH